MCNTMKECHVIKNLFKKCYSLNAPERPGLTTIMCSRPLELEMTKLYSRAIGA
jgi:hypothetical protein